MSLGATIWRVLRVIGGAALFGILFGVAAAALGFAVGLGFSFYDEVILGRGNPQGPMLFLLTTPIGVLVGIIFGAVRELRVPPTRAVPANVSTVERHT